MSYNAVSRVEILVISCKQAVEFCYEGGDLIDDVIVSWPITAVYDDRIA